MNIVGNVYDEVSREGVVVFRHFKCGNVIHLIFEKTKKNPTYPHFRNWNLSLLLENLILNKPFSN